MRLKSVPIHYLLSVAAFLVCGFVQSQPLTYEHATESLVQPFPNSSVVSSSLDEDVVHEVALGILQRDSGVASPENAQLVTGNLAKTLYEIPKEFSGKAVFDFFTAQFADRNYQPLFDCSGRACGSSNDWANDIFGNRLLYGPVQNQYYGAFQQSADNSLSPFITLYVITRGNRRLYAYVEVVEPHSSTSDAGAQVVPSFSAELASSGFATLPEIQFVNDEITDDSQLELLRNALGADQDLQIYVVAHLAGSETLGRLQERSLRRAQSVVESLIASGIGASRLSAHGLGPLAPNCSTASCLTRIDIVRR